MIKTRLANNAMSAIKPKSPVVDGHEHYDGEKTDRNGVESAIDVVLTEARADGAVFDFINRRGQRACPEQQRKIARFAGGQAGGSETVLEDAASRRSVNYLFGPDRTIANRAIRDY